MTVVRDGFEAELKAAQPTACINGENAERSWSLTNVGFPNVESELLLLPLSERGVDDRAGRRTGSPGHGKSAPEEPLAEVGEP